MTNILITGAAGMLGRHVAEALANNPEVTLRLMSRRSFDPGVGAPKQRSRINLRRIAHYDIPSSAIAFPTASWVQADLQRGENLSEAVRGIDVIVHCAGDPHNLLAAARTAGVSHFVYISIVGCDRIPFFYYQQKVAEEKAIKASGIPFSILRATQFHALIDLILRGGSLFPWMTIAPTDLRFQSIAECEVGRRMAAIALAPPSGEYEELGGPQVLSLGEMVHTWATLRQVRHSILPLRIPGKVADGYRRGDNTCGTELPHGEITWAQWIKNTYHL